MDKSAEPAEPAEPVTGLEKKEFIKKFVTERKSQYVEIENENSMNNIYQLLSTKEIVLVKEPIECLYYGWYFQYVELDPVKMKYYYTLCMQNKQSSNGMSK